MYGEACGASVNVGNYYVGDAALYTIVIISNGVCPLWVGTVTATGDVTVTSQPAKHWLFPGQSTTCTIHIDTSSIGNKSGTISIPNSSANSPCVLTLTARVWPAAVVAKLECRTKGGIATLCGFSEFCNASTPPKKYLIDTISGQMYICYFGKTPACVGALTDTDTYPYSGQFIYDPAAGCTRNSLTIPHYIKIGAPLCAPQMAVGATNWSPNPFVPGACSESGPNYTFARTSITCVKQYDGSTCMPPVGVTEYYIMYGSRMDSLSSEDTEFAAITRLLAGASWSSWGTVGAGCTNPSCCLAQYESRTSGFSLSYQDSEYRISTTGLYPNTIYFADIHLYRRIYGVGSYVLYSTVTIAAMTNGAGAFTYTGSTPNDFGYQTYAHDALIRPF